MIKKEIAVIKETHKKMKHANKNKLFITMKNKGLEKLTIENETLC